MELGGRPIEHRYILGLDLLKRHGINWNVTTMEPEWPQTDFCSENGSGSGDAPQPEVSTDVEEEWAVEDSAEHDSSEMLVMEVLPYVSRGVGDRYPRRQRFLGCSTLARVTVEAPIAEAVHFIKAIGSQEVSALEVPSGVPEHLQQLYDESCGLLNLEQQQELATS